MNREEYLDFHKNFCEDMIDVTQKKNSDYSGFTGDPFANFRIVESIGVCDVETGFLTRMSDKFSRLNTFAKKKELKVKEETVYDTLLDLANYCVLMSGYIKSKENG